MGRGDVLASGGRTATFGPARVSQKKWDEIWADDVAKEAEKEFHLLDEREPDDPES